jgi:predicted nucleic acid-binding protein
LTDRIVLDSSPLSLLCQRSTARGVPEIRAWLTSQTSVGKEVYVAEIADYEVRRELLRAGKAISIRRLERLIAELRYLPINTTTMRRAAEFWAQARNLGTPTAPPEALDADVILAAQAESVGAMVATENVGHLARFVTAKPWRDIK